LLKQVIMSEEEYEAIEVKLRELEQLKEKYSDANTNAVFAQNDELKRLSKSLFMRDADGSLKGRFNRHGEYEWLYIDDDALREIFSLAFRDVKIYEYCQMK